MQNLPHILADGIPNGVIFGAAVFVMWILGSALSSKPKPEDFKKPSMEAQQIAEARRRLLAEQAAQRPALTPRIQQKRAKKQQQQQRARQQNAAREQQAREQQIRAQRDRAAQADLQPPPLPAAESVASTQEIGSESPSVRRKQSETARNVRMMLQRGGVAEAFVLGEVFGKPKGLQDMAS